MARLCRTLFGICWALGLFSMAAGVVLKLMPEWSARLGFYPRGALIFAGTLFLCGLATREMERTALPPS